MREIKFRVWDKENREMYYQNDFAEELGLNDKRFSKQNEIETLFNGDFLTVLSGNAEDFLWLQYTGLKDKNGKEIYEGDVVRKEDKYKNEVEWEVGVIKFEDGSFDVFDGEGVLYYPEERWIEQWSIIGNIYENSELLNKTNG